MTTIRAPTNMNPTTIAKSIIIVCDPPGNDGSTGSLIDDPCKGKPTGELGSLPYRDLDAGFMPRKNPDLGQRKGRRAVKYYEVVKLFLAIVWR